MTVKFLSFDYTKDDGKESHRDFVCITEPTDKYFGIDVSELGIVEQAEFYDKVQRLYETLHADTLALMQEFDIKFKFRYFKPDSVRNVVVD